MHFKVRIPLRFLDYTKGLYKRGVQRGDKILANPKKFTHCHVRGHDSGLRHLDGPAK